MKFQYKSFGAVLVFTVVFASQYCELLAAPSNGTRLPGTRQVELGYEYNNMFKRTVANSYGNLKTQDHFYTVSFGVCDWFSLDGKIGMGNITQGGTDQLPHLDYNAGFAGGYGFRIGFFDYKKWAIRMIAGFQHISVHPQDRSVDNDKYESFLDDWQASIIVAKDIKFATFYAGIKGSDCEIVYKVNKHDKKRRFSESHTGLITGAEWYLFDRKARLSVEGRFLDETALSTSISCLF